MTFRGIAFVPVVISITLALTACNDSKLVNGATCTPSATAAPASIAAVRPAAPHFVPSANAAAGSITAQDLLSAIDADPSGFSNVTVTGNAKQYTVFTTLGTVLPSAGTSFAWFSTGVAGAGTASTLDASVTGTQSGTDLTGAACPGNANSHDCVTLSFSFVVPDGLHSVAFDFNFMSTEYPEFVGLGYNDSFVVSMASASHNFTNLVFDHNNNPINIDSVLFTETCQQLTGTGFDLQSFGSCDAGGTGLLTTTAPVEPGENVTLTFSVYDSGDGIYDSAVMLDNLRVTPEPVGTPNTGTPTPPEPTPTATPDSCPA